MNFTDEALQILAQQLGDDALSSRGELESKLAKLLYLVLRTGRGRPPLVQWVQRTLAVVAPASRTGRAVDPKWAAPRLARLLCLQLLQNVRSKQGTMVNRQTVAVAC
jgi:hypothetical protein